MRRSAVGVQVLIGEGEKVFSRLRELKAVTALHDELRARRVFELFEMLAYRTPCHAQLARSGRNGSLAHRMGEGGDLVRAGAFGRQSTARTMAPISITNLTSQKRDVRSAG